MFKYPNQVIQFNELQIFSIIQRFMSLINIIIYFIDIILLNMTIR
jgi:hypothetical protein